MSLCDSEKSVLIPVKSGNLIFIFFIILLKFNYTDNQNKNKSAMTSKHTLASGGIAHHFEELQGIFSVQTVDDIHIMENK